jgi:hypothetical protein
VIRLVEELTLENDKGSIKLDLAVIKAALEMIGGELVNDRVT